MQHNGFSFGYSFMTVVNTLNNIFVQTFLVQEFSYKIIYFRPYLLYVF